MPKTREAVPRKHAAGPCRELSATDVALVAAGKRATPANDLRLRAAACLVRRFCKILPASLAQDDRSAPERDRLELHLRQGRSIRKIRAASVAGRKGAACCP